MEERMCEWRERLGDTRPDMLQLQMVSRLVVIGNPKLAEELVCQRLLPSQTSELNHKGDVQSPIQLSCPFLGKRDSETGRMVRAPCCEKMGQNKGPWTPDEDKVLVDYIQRYGHGNWRALPKLAGLLRCGKSCRLRWVNYLKPDIKRGNFTKEEEDTIIRLHQQLGNRWSAIAACLPGRTDNEIKNVWNTHLKKLMDPEIAQIEPTKKRRKKKKGDSAMSVSADQSQISESSLDAREESSSSEIDERFWLDVLSISDSSGSLMNLTTTVEHPLTNSDSTSSVAMALMNWNDNDDDMEFWRKFSKGIGDWMEFSHV